MPRKKTILSDKFPYHVTTRSNHKSWFQISLVKVWEIALNALHFAHEKYPIRLHGFVLMNNHYHLVLDTPNSDINLFMYEFNKNFSLQLRIETQLINRMFGGRYKWSLIQNRDQYFHVMKYVFLNPVKVKIVDDATKYKYSSLYVEKNKSHFPIQVQPYFKVLDVRFLNWIHQMHTEEQNHSIIRGLRKSTFRFSGTRQIRNPPNFDCFG